MKTIDKIYIIHLEKLKDRKEYLDNFLGNIDIPFEYVISDEIKDASILSEVDKYYEYKSEVYERKLNNSEICVSVQHFEVYKKILKSNIKYSLILEDDAVFTEDFSENLDKILNQLPENFTMCFISTCCNLHKKNIRHSKLVYESKTSRCVTGYIVNKDKLKDILLTLPFQYPIDWHLNHINQSDNYNYFWSEPCIINQGSEFKYKSNLR